jgi:hypothetical protein
MRAEAPGPAVGGTDRRGQTVAVLMSPGMMCKNLGIDPQAYQFDVLDRISTRVQAG